MFTLGALQHVCESMGMDAYADLPTNLAFNGESTPPSHVTPRGSPSVSLCGGSAEKPRMSSIFRQKGNQKKKNKNSKGGVNINVGNEVAEHKFMPEASKHADNGWQMNYVDAQSRIASLFNSYTMSDVIFQVEVHSIPAHTFILASASPVFYRELFEEGSSPRFLDGAQKWGDGRHRTLSIMNVPHLAFFEFLQFIYTNHVSITLDNVLQLIFLADTYKVTGLSAKCLDFIQAQVVPGSVLRVLNIVRGLSLKAVIASWRQVVAHRQVLNTFCQLTLAERRALRDDAGENSSMGSRVLSRGGSYSSFKSTMSFDILNSIGYNSQLLTYSENAVHNMKRLLGKLDFGFHGSITDMNIMQFVEEHTGKCWKCMQDHTEVVLLGPDFADQNLKLVRQILRLENCSVPEIVFFRAAHEWSIRQCKKLGREPTDVMKREVLGDETLSLLRFPVMTVEQFEWEVIPSGLLEYEDVQQLLNYMTQRVSSNLGTRFNDEPRSNKTLGKNHPCEAEALGNSSYFYTPATEDMLDGMLASKLLQIFLKGASDFRQDGRATPEFTSKLPPLALSGAVSSTAKMRSVGPDGNLVWPIRPLGTARGRLFPLNGVKRAEMVLGQRGLVPKWHADHAFSEGLARRPQARDFQRLAPGLYRYCGDRLLEMWLEAGEPMLLDRGPWPKLDQFCPSGQYVGDDNRTPREVLGLSPVSPFGKGLPLSVFLTKN
eukprot:TRINITY_DN56608_c0_g1_i1.p1 TRINITY_DN56608_c0_g1~~TRINITY_DN56608_c0_g1_i1.p1  ORF type:complete len:737 (-),score=73.39 TRINITY_DN56608_c0_g1_i1:105-2246(-)